MNPTQALTVMLIVFALGEIVADKTKAILSATLVIAFTLLMGFWFKLPDGSFVFPHELFAISSIGPTAGVLIGILITSLGTLMDVEELKRQWKTVLVGVISVVIATGAILAVGPFIFGRNLAFAGAPIFAGANVATLIMLDAVKKEITEPEIVQSLSSFILLVLVFQNFVGIPVSSFLLRKEARRFLKDPESMALYLKNETKGQSAGAPSKRRLLQLPGSFDRPIVTLAKLAVVTCIAQYLAGLTRGQVHFFVVCLLMGIFFTELGFLERQALSKSGSGTLIMFATTMVIFANLTQTTPEQNEIPEYLARRMPEVGSVFIQGESEVASISMVYGAASAGTRAMTSSSSAGISLKSEGISYCASARIPMVYANVSRGGPGVGSIQPAQMDYLQATKASGNGGFEMMVFAPSSAQEAVDMTYKAFDYADRDRNPVLILCDGLIGTLMEPVELPHMKTDQEVADIEESKRTWACAGHKLDYANRSWIQPGHWSTAAMQRINERAAALYESWGSDVRAEECGLEDAEIVLAAYGASGRVAKSVADILRNQGKKIGLIRPQTVHPFPFASFEKLDYGRVKAVLDVEMSIPALMVQDVDRAVKNRCPIHTCLCSGGNIMKKGQVLEAAAKLLELGDC